MSEEIKKSFLDKEVTRRQFLKMSGKGLAGLSMTAAMLSLFGCSQEQVDAGVVEVVATPTALLVANRAKCTGCQRCEVTCTLVNDGKAQPYISRLKMRDNLYLGEKIADDNWHGDGVYGVWTFGPTTCKQCADPKCMTACPVKAIVADETTGTRVVKADLCIGCGACTKACPWGLPTVDPETKISTKCITCGACTKACPTSVLKVIPWEDVVAAM